MKKIGAKVAYVVLGILSFFGIWPASATPIPQPQANQLNEVKPTTPLYLKHSADMIPKMSQEKNLTLATIGTIILIETTLRTMRTTRIGRITHIITAINKLTQKYST